MAENDRLKGKVLVVTGASSGIGQEVAVMAASRGARVTLCGQNEARLVEARETCVRVSGGHGDRFVFVQGDLTNSDTRRRTIQTTINTFGRLDSLIANAGLNLPNAGILDATETTYDRLMDVNVKSVFFLIQEAVPYLEQSQGSIVNVSSLAAQKGYAPNIIYPMTKASVDHMTRCLALDLGPKGIRVNAVNPSFAETRIRRFAGDDAANDEAVAKIAAIESKLQPYQGRCLTVQEVAEPILFLATAAAGFVTGQCLLIDGGRGMMGPFSSNNHE